MAVGGRALGQAEGRSHGERRAFGARFRAIVNHDVPALLFSSGGTDEVVFFGFDKLPR